MMLSRQLLPLLLTCILTYSCGNEDKEVSGKVAPIIPNSSDTVVKYGYGITLRYNPDTEKIPVELQIFSEGSLIYSDHANQYTFGDSLNPGIIHFEDGTKIVFLEVENQPSKNYYKALAISNEAIMDSMIVTKFVGTTKRKNDTNEEWYYGYWDYGQRWMDSSGLIELTDYNPRIYYKKTSVGFNIDSIKTKQYNTALYGHFHGYEISEDLNFPVRSLDSIKSTIRD